MGWVSRVPSRAPSLYWPPHPPSPCGPRLRPNSRASGSPRTRACCRAGSTSSAASRSSSPRRSPVSRAGGHPLGRRGAAHGPVRRRRRRLLPAVRAPGVRGEERHRGLWPPPANAAHPPSVLACLEKDPQRRPRSAADAASRLDVCALDDSWTADAAPVWWASRGRAIAARRAGSGAPAIEQLAVHRARRSKSWSRRSGLNRYHP